MSEENREAVDPSARPEVEPASAGAAQARPSWLRRLGHTLFSSETRIGRAIRAILIGTGLVIVAFGLGMLVSYLWLTRPLTIQLSQSQADLQAVQTELNQARDRLSAVEAGSLALQADNEMLETQLLQAETRIQLMWVMYQARLAQNALQNRDQAIARRALQAARAELDAALPVIEAKDEEVAQSLSLRLNVATSDMVRSPTTALADLEVLINNLILLERLLAQP
ncbi:MAG: hypothetical protein ROW52_13400 [Anaerolineaceae bacterium]|jgi:multidrug efflux pump subunit AcrA (membrane-fusion protein)